MEYKNIGRLSNIEFLESEFGILATDELILTDERDAHIKQRHDQDYILFCQCVHEVIRMPDMILKDSKNPKSVFYIKYIEEAYLCIVVRLSLEVEGTNRKNSIITSYLLGQKTLKRIKKNNKTLYNRE